MDIREIKRYADYNLWANQKLIETIQVLSDEELRAIYDAWGRWKYLAYWFDLWQTHHQRREKRG